MYTLINKMYLSIPLSIFGGIYISKCILYNILLSKEEPILKETKNIKLNLDEIKESINNLRNSLNNEIDNLNFKEKQLNNIKSTLEEKEHNLNLKDLDLINREEIFNDKENKENIEINKSFIAIETIKVEN